MPWNHILSPISMPYAGFDPRSLLWRHQYFLLIDRNVVDTILHLIGELYVKKHANGKRPF